MKTHTTSSRFLSTMAATLAIAATSSPSALAQGTGGCPTQRLFLNDQFGEFLEVSDYATAPTVTSVGMGFAGRDTAYDATTGKTYICNPGPLGASQILELDANYDPVGAPIVLDGVEWGSGLDIDSNGVMWCNTLVEPNLVRYDPATGTTTIVATNLDSPGISCAVDVDGTVWTNNANGTIDVYDPQTGTVTHRGTIGASAPLLVGIEIDCDGTIYLHSLIGGLYTMDRATLATTLVGPTSQLRWALHFREPADGGADTIGTRYCGPSSPNSTGAGALLSATGSELVQDDDVTLVASGLPSGSFGYFLNSRTQGATQPAGSQGTLCVDGQVGRFDAMIFNSGATGTGSLAVDLTSMPTPSGAVPVAPGDTWNFTCWYRDANPGATSNFTDAISITFQ